MATAQPWKTPEPNSWWSATGKTSSAKAFTNALALTLADGKSFAVMTSPGVMESVPVANLTAATRMALVDADWIERSSEQARRINDVDARMEQAKSVVGSWRAHGPGDTQQLLDTLTPILKDGV